MNDPIEMLSHAELLRMSADVQVQLEKNTANRPVLFMLARARQTAAAAITQLVIIEPDRTAEIRSLQNEVRLYDNMVDACRAMLERGKEADARIREEDREDMHELLISDEQRKLYGLDNRGFDS
jgi:hypothetical protein